MDSSHDNLALTTQEQQLLNALEDAVRHHDRRLKSPVQLGGRRLRHPSSRMRDAAALLVLVAGGAFTLATFAAWPVVAIGGVVLQAVAIRHYVTRVAPAFAEQVRRRTSATGTSKRQ